MNDIDPPSDTALAESDIEDIAFDRRNEALNGIAVEAALDAKVAQMSARHDP